ncbi:major facilitator superfamily transporter [Rhypophila decipiens]|uniref:Major facilitator superfamily transporter n=1 Tax=Rhypophila decipiens TaxID=261697 RepID=A0AAN6YFI4_9PEZI|nr:major facilitator superfamily transporter [Rhypophila decipiens]
MPTLLQKASLAEPPRLRIGIPPACDDVENGQGAQERQENAVAVEDRPGLPKARFLMLGTGIGTGLFLAMLDASIVSTSLYSISAEFPGSLETINWVGLAYTLAFLSCAVLFARISDVIGRKAAFLSAYFIFIAFSVGCGFARSLNQLIVLRALQGIGGSGLYSIAIIIFPEVATNEQKKLIAGFIGVILAVAGVLGPILGGILTEYATWRWVFWVNGPVGSVSAILFLLTWPEERYLPVLERRKWSEVDYLGSFLLIASAALLVFPFQNSSISYNQNPRQNHWATPTFLAPLLASILCLTALFAWQYFLHTHQHQTSITAPAIPLSLLKNHVYTFTVLNTLCTGFPYLLAVYAFPLRFQVVNGRTALGAGVMMLPMLAGSAVGSALGGAVNGKGNRLSETLVVACGLTIVGCASLTTLSSSGESYEPKALGLLVFLGLGFGLAATASSILGTVESSAREHATAQGIIAQVRILGGSLGIACSSAVLGVELTDNGRLSQLLSPEQLAHLASTMSEGVLSEEQKNAVRVAYTDALWEDMVISCAVAGLGLLFALGVYRKGRLTIEESLARHVGGEEERKRRVES